MNPSTKSKSVQQSLFPELADMISGRRKGKDELNLAEFPIASIADRLPKDQKTLYFSDRIEDPSTGEWITRNVTVSGSDEYGLPTATDDLIMVALQELSVSNNFRNQTVRFSRYQVVELLGWKQTTKNYRRIKESLNRWAGVTLYYDNAWWDKGNKQWMSETFHIIDNVSIWTRDNPGGRDRSEFTWNNVIWKSFHDKNIKNLDFEIIRALNSSIAIRMYRFLDKRFWHRKHRIFNLQQFAFDKVGLARSYKSAAQIKRKLNGAIEELVEVGFLEPLPDSERYEKLSKGVWNVQFRRARPSSENAQENLPIEVTELPELQRKLMKNGVDATMAKRLIGEFEPDLIEAKIEALEYILKSDPSKVQNPPGFLIDSIRNPDAYKNPAGFISKEEQSQQELELRDKKKRIAEIKQEKERQQEEEEEKVSEKYAKTEKLVREYFSKVGAPRQAEIEKEALASANEFEKKLIENGGAFAEQTRQAVITKTVLRLIEEK